MAGRVGEHGKDGNPKSAVGVRKSCLSTVPAPVMQEVGVAMLEGAVKYGRHNWRESGARASVYYDAAMRHLMAWWEGQDEDPDSSLSHLVKAIAGLTVLRDAQLMENWVDDRPRPVQYDWIDQINRTAAGIIARYTDEVPTSTEQGE